MSSEQLARRSTSTKSARSPESFDSLRTRDAAAEILQSYEKLSWLSFHRCETITQTRLHFQRVLAGFDNDAVTWKEDYSRHPKPEDHSKPSRKGKERVSPGGNEAASESVGEGRARERISSGHEGVSEGISDARMKQQTSRAGDGHAVTRES